MKLPVEEHWSSSFAYDKIWKKAHEREQFKKLFEIDFSTLTVHTEIAEVSPEWIPGWTTSCKSNKWTYMSMRELSFSVLSYSPCAGNVPCSRMPIARCHCVLRGHSGNYLGRSFILQMKRFRSRIVKRASQRQLIPELDLSPRLCTHTPITFLGFGFRTIRPNPIMTKGTSIDTV